MKQINTLWGKSTVVNVQAGGTYNRSYCALNSQNGAHVQYQCILPQNKRMASFIHTVNVYTDIVQVELLDLRAQYKKHMQKDLKK